MDNVVGQAVAAPYQFFEPEASGLIQLLQALRERALTPVALLDEWGYVTDLPMALSEAAQRGWVGPFLPADPCLIDRARVVLYERGAVVLWAVESLTWANLLPSRYFPGGPVDAYRWLRLLAGTGPHALFHLATLAETTEDEVIRALHWLSRSALVMTVGDHEDRTAAIAPRGEEWLRRYEASL